MDDLEKLLIKLEELRMNCFPFQTNAQRLVCECIEHAADAQERLDNVLGGEDGQNPP